MRSSRRTGYANHLLMLERVFHHARCGECREEYEALLTALKRMQELEENGARPD